MPLTAPGPWAGVSELIGYGGRIWFVNSVKFRDHNSADVYSYDPVGGETRYERHLFSQDAGTPTVAGGVLYWPFEDSRFSTRHGEYMVTNGRDWQWRLLPDGEVFHVHAMIAHRDDIFAATGAWRGGLQRSHDGGLTWQIVYDHPTEPRSVSRITTLAVLADTLYAGLTDYRPQGGKLLKWTGRTLEPVRGWPAGTMVTALTAYRTWLYAVNETDEGSATWRTNGKASRRVDDLNGHRVRDFASGPDALWAVTASEGTGSLWRSTDGVKWARMQEFRDAEPLDVLVYAGRVYVGTKGPNGRGTLWGPRSPVPVVPPHDPPRLAIHARPLTRERFKHALSYLDRVLASESTYTNRRGGLFGALVPLALSKTNQVGEALVERLLGPFPAVSANRFGGKLNVTATQMAQWNLLWAIAYNGEGRIAPEFLSQPWAERPNRSEKYLHPVPAAAWAVAQIAQADDDTIAALMAGLENAEYPLWVKGDLVGALTVLTGQRFGYDMQRWRSWWKSREEGQRQGRKTGRAAISLRPASMWW